MSAGWTFFLFALLLSALLLFGMVFFVIMFSDLESDYINPIDLCNKLNQFVLPEHGAHAFLAILFLLFQEWLAFLLNLPLLVHNTRKIMNRNHMHISSSRFTWFHSFSTSTSSLPL
ncbi:hypothetical protein AX16_004044 [Volvariella volvacea WC 439]|nr:hypothetical protein AX16_004044 [Volvariella volvacea WC 439]